MRSSHGSLGGASVQVGKAMDAANDDKNGLQGHGEYEIKDQINMGKEYEEDRTQRGMDVLGGKLIGEKDGARQPWLELGYQW